MSLRTTVTTLAATFLMGAALAVSPPAQGINTMGVEFDYVRFWREDS